MNTRLIHIVAAFALAAGGAAAAQTQHLHGASGTVDAPAVAEFTEAEVRKVDLAAGRITLKHGEIRNLDMPPMTMVFAVSKAALLEQVKAGDKVRFRAASQQGQLTVTEVQRLE
jgi:Cu/Ag efflux protein CusF